MRKSCTHRVQSGRKNCREVSGVLCDRKTKVNILGEGGQGYSVRPALLFGAETWALNPMYEK